MQLVWQSETEDSGVVLSRITAKFNHMSWGQYSSSLLSTKMSDNELTRLRAELALAITKARSAQALYDLYRVVATTNILLRLVLWLAVVLCMLGFAWIFSDGELCSWSDGWVYYVAGAMIGVAWQVIVAERIVAWCMVILWMPHLESIGFGVKDTEDIAELLGVAVWRIERYWSESSSDMEEVD